MRKLRDGVRTAVPSGDLEAMNSIFSRMGAIYRVLRRTVGVKVIQVFVAVFFGFIRTVVAIFMALDHVFFPKYAKTRTNRPIVLVGNPRTGTTFLQRFLSGEGFSSGLDRCVTVST